MAPSSSFIEARGSSGTAARRVISVLLGMLLLGAAGFKAHELWTDPSLPVSLFSSSRWHAAFIELETILGLWLLLGIYLWGAWASALGMFLLLAGVSLYLGIIGQPSCGCFGKLTINPWYTFGVDVIAFAVLWHWRPWPMPLAALICDSLAHSRPRSILRLFAEVMILLAIGAGSLYALGVLPLTPSHPCGVSG